MTLHLPAITSVVHSHYASTIADEHGEAGIAAFRKLLEFIGDLYTYVDPDTYQGKLTIFRALSQSVEPILRADAEEISSVNYAAQTIGGNCFIEVLENRRALVWRDRSFDLNKIAKQAVVYSYQGRIEHFHAGARRAQVEKIDTSCASNFAIPTFDDLKEALEEYKAKMIRHSSCLIFKQTWFDDNRLFFKAKQEYAMRNSLCQHLKSRVRGNVDVRPEQTVDSSHPIDIKVTWLISPRIGLIEIKWLGKSRNHKKITAEYYQSRALDGAKQLAGYLDKNKVQAPTHKTRGYLVIVDARRAKLNKSTKRINRTDGLKYASEEIKYNPEYHDKRTDFEAPIRMFAEPICQP